MSKRKHIDKSKIPAFRPGNEDFTRWQNELIAKNDLQALRDKAFAKRNRKHKSRLPRNLDNKPVTIIRNPSLVYSTEEFTPAHIR